MKVFRHFRESIITGNGFRKYVFYALGEIVLVVVGILIALGANNWKEKQQIKVDTLRTAKLVEEQLEKDYNEIYTILTQWDEATKITDTILQQTPLGEPLPEKCIACYDVLLGLNLPNISERIPNLIDRKPLYKGKVEKKLYEIDLKYKNALRGIGLFEQSILNQLEGNLAFWKDNYYWFSTYVNEMSCPDKNCLDYFRNSADYRNRVAYFRLTVLESYYGNLYEFMKSIEADKEELIELIQAYD